MKFEPYLEPSTLYPIDLWCKRFSLTVGICLLSWLALYGCASMDYEWIQTRPASAKPWTYIVVANAESECVKSGMQAASGRRLIACAHWRPENCEIILPIGYQQWIKEHEEQHCEGMTHK